MKDWHEFIDKIYTSDEELEKDLKDCGIPKRICFQAEPRDVCKEYPVFEKTGYWRSGTSCTGILFELWVGSSEKMNEIIGEEIFKPDMVVTSFIGNVVLDYLLKREVRG